MPPFRWTILLLLDQRQNTQRQCCCTEQDDRAADGNGSNAQTFHDSILLFDGISSIAQAVGYFTLFLSRLRFGREFFDRTAGAWRH